jgi:branched-chain amino acid transport system ATP-binding protein
VAEPGAHGSTAVSATAVGTAVLEVHDLTTSYGPVRALDGVSLTAEAGRITAVLGANGAGKTTLLKTISGMVHQRGGTIKLGDSALHTMKPSARVRLGLAHVPEGRQIFNDLTVRENLELGAYLRRDARIENDLGRVYDLFPRLKEREKQKAGTMSGGEQQMLAIGRAMMAEPKLLLLDEPGMGLAPILVERIYETIAAINKQGTTILLVEQNANFALEYSSRGYVLETGTVALSDKSEALRENPEVQKAYLGA